MKYTYQLWRSPRLHCCVYVDCPDHAVMNRSDGAHSGADGHGRDHAGKSLIAVLLYGASLQTSVRACYLHHLLKCKQILINK